MIKEEEPPKPSTQLSGRAGCRRSPPSAAIEPGQLSRLLRGDLDWIVMKALEKDRDRRYETANGLAATSSGTWQTSRWRPARRRRRIASTSSPGGTRPP